MADIAVPPRAELLIRLNQNGSVSVTGPFQDQLLFYGLLEVAKQTCAEQARAARGGGQILIPELKPPPM